MADPVAINAEPPGRFGFIQMLPTLVFDVAIPIIAFNVLIRFGVPTLWALVTGGLSPAIRNLYGWVKSRRLQPLGVIVMSFLAIGTAASLISGNVFFALIKDSLLTATFGFICLGSLLTAKPLMFYINRQFVAGNDPARLEWWNGLWQYPHFRAALRTVSAVWGIAYVLQAFLTISFALFLSPAQVVLISPLIAVGMLIALIAWNQRYMLALRERRTRDAQSA